MSNLQNLFDQQTNSLALVNADTLACAREFEARLGDYIKPKKLLKQGLCTAIARKLKAYDEKNNILLKECVKKRIYLNFFEKKQLRAALDTQEKELLPHKVRSDPQIFNLYKTANLSLNELTSQLNTELELPLNRRTKERNSSLAPDLITAIFAEYVFLSVPKNVARTYFLNWELSETDYFSYASKSTNDYFDQQESLGVITVTDTSELNKLNERIEYARSALRNHSFFVVLLSEAAFESNSSFWTCIEKTIFRAEKGNCEKLPYRFVRKEHLCAELKDGEPVIDVTKIDFDSVYSGCYYIDTFYVDNAYSEDNDIAAIVFENNRYDETRIPCPVCHSEEVEGNSYSKLGVKSWECQNLLCGARSRSNRGNRFSFYSTLRQSSIENESDFIEPTRIKTWNRDVVDKQSFEDVVRFAIDFYSTENSKLCWLSDLTAPTHNRRSISKIDELSIDVEEDKLDAYRLRFEPLPCVCSDNPKHSPLKIGNHQLWLGNSASVLASLPPNLVDAAVTSPPYYNAKEYSQWSNIYLYYADMKINAQQVYRSLKDGGVYFFNIFNYFDNENDIVKSAMGKKRLILSSVITDIFTEIGFSLYGNIVWDKGHIEGKRGFNNGNFSPFHQQPFNCWEHILIFSKGTPKDRYIKDLPKVFAQKPYIKIIAGENKLGHTAPFPIELPQLLASRMEPNEIILDPYAGSGTTALAAEKFHLKALLIEAKNEYLQLSKRRIEEAIRSPFLSCRRLDLI